MLAKNPDLHRLGFNRFYTPQEESPTSLAMYTYPKFTEWRRGLVANEVDLENFINQELERNSLLYPGWEAETLYDLFAHRDRLELDIGYHWACSDCSKNDLGFRVQPYWRHLMERIKRRIDPDDPAQADSEVNKTDDAETKGVVEATSSSNNLGHERDVTGNVPHVDPNELLSESERESEIEGDIHGYPEMVSARSGCVYAPHEMVCMDCWVYYRQTDQRFVKVGVDWEDDSPADKTPSLDESSEDEYSPYLIHS